MTSLQLLEIVTRAHLGSSLKSKLTGCYLTCFARSARNIYASATARHCSMPEITPCGEYPRSDRCTSCSSRPNEPPGTLNVTNSKVAHKDQQSVCTCNKEQSRLASLFNDAASDIIAYCADVSSPALKQMSRLPPLCP